MISRINLRRLAAAVCAASLAVGAASAGTVPAASAATTSNCSISQATATKAFATFGDLGWYYRAPGGGFEGASIGWAQRGAPSIVSTSHLFNLYPGSGDHALRLPEGSRVTTPKLCVSPDTPHMRFLARARDGDELKVEVRIYDDDHDDDDEDDDWEIVESSNNDVSPSDHPRWRPSEKISLEVDRLRRWETRYVDIRFSSQGDWTIDDVLIDPYRRG